MSAARREVDLSAIALLLTDVDGVLTDGRIHFDAEGRELKDDVVAKGGRP